MTKYITFELSVPLNGPLGLAVNSAIDSVNKICEAYQGKATLRIVVKITSQDHDDYSTMRNVKRSQVYD